MEKKLMEFTTKEIILAILGSGALVGGIISALTFVSSYVDKRRERAKEKSNELIHDSIEAKRLQGELQTTKDNTVIENLWKLIEEYKREIEDLERDLKAASMSRATVNTVYRNIRAIRKEIESLNVMILSEEDTNVFMRRFQTVKQILDETENLLP